MTPQESNPSLFGTPNSCLRIKHVIPTQIFITKVCTTTPKNFCTAPHLHKTHSAFIYHAWQVGMTPLESNPSPFCIANSHLRIKHIIPTPNFHHQSVNHQHQKFLYCTTPAHNTQCFHLSCMASVNNTIGMQSITVRHSKFTSVYQTRHANPQYSSPKCVPPPPKNFVLHHTYTKHTVLSSIMHSKCE